MLTVFLKTFLNLYTICWSSWPVNYLKICLSWFFIGYWILKRGWIFIRALFFILYPSFISIKIVILRISLSVNLRFMKCTLSWKKGNVPIAAEWLRLYVCARSWLIVKHQSNQYPNERPTILRKPTSNS